MNCMVLLVVLVAGQDSPSPGAANVGFERLPGQVRQAIVDHHYRKVGVVPAVMVIAEQAPSLFEDTALGPQGKLLAESFQAGLTALADGQFDVVADPQITDALYDLSAKDLGRAEKLGQIAKRFGGIDALAVLLADDRRAEVNRSSGRRADLRIRCRLLDLKDASVADEKDEDLYLSIADAACIGDSFELRRWAAAELRNIGLHEREADDWAGSDDYSASGKYTDICRSRKAPQENIACPFRMIIVGPSGSCPVDKIDGKFYVALDMGDTFYVRLINYSDQPVYAALFVDGINVLGKKREHPARCRHWYLAAGDFGDFEGFYSEDQQRLQEEGFQIGHKSESVAMRQGYGEAVGRITAVFYTMGLPQQQPTYRTETKRVWVPGPTVSQPPAKPEWIDGQWRMRAPASESVSGGTWTGVTVQVEGPPRFIAPAYYQGADRGLMLAAMTIYHRPSSVLEKLRADHGSTRLAIDQELPDDSSEPAPPNSFNISGFRVWEYERDEQGRRGYFAKRGGNDWVEVKNGQVYATFVQVGRTADYVQLFDQSRQMMLRLYANEVKWTKTSQSEWHTLPFAIHGRSAPSYEHSPAYRPAYTTPAPQPADTSPDRYAAIAFSPSTYRHGYAYNEKSLEAAQESARRYCGEADARVVIWSRNAWCALALGDSQSAWGYAAGNTADEAMRQAMAYAQRETSNGVSIAVCVSAADGALK